MHVQCADSVVCIEGRHVTCVCNEVIDTAVPNDLSSVGSGLLQAGIAGEVSMEDMDIGPFAQFCRNLLLRPSLVADQADDYILRIF